MNIAFFANFLDTLLEKWPKKVKKKVFTHTLFRNKVRIKTKINKKDVLGVDNFPIDKEQQ